MGLNVSKGDMYEWVTHTWNAIKGRCYHDCSYCYMKRWGALNQVRLDRREFKTDLGSDNFIFVGSSCDMFAQDIPEEWIKDVLTYCAKFDNRYLFQTKNPANIRRILPDESRVCVTLETNRYYPEVMRNSPTPEERFKQMLLIRHPLYITIEPIMDFDLGRLCDMIIECAPVQVNIGADSGRNGLPEPDADNVRLLIDVLSKFTTVKEKKNLSRILS